MSRRYLFVLLAVLVLTLMLAGHYSYNNFQDGIVIVTPHDVAYRLISKASFFEKFRKAGMGTDSSEALLLQPFPQKIWQTWKDDSESPTDRTIDFPHEWREKNPGWRYERLTDSNNDAYVRDNFDESIVEIFTELKDPIMKADYLRYLIMLREGGVWADIDVLPHQPISRWIPDQFNSSANLVIGIENDHHKEPIWPGIPYSVQLCQYTMLAKPGHPAIKALVDQVTEDLKQWVKVEDEIPFDAVMETIGPFAFTNAMMDYFFQKTGVEYNGDELDSLPEPELIDDVLVLPKDSFGWLPKENSHEYGDEAILVEHLFIGSWRDSHPGK